ncbi:MAG: hypothetical protein JWL76_2143 [Thermoleophilia bacterium]|nr:hypothetical protein [Thermoleophilia bacterium]
MTLSVELQPRDGGWIRLGDQQDGGHGVAPGSIEFGGDLNEYGCLDASFRLKLNPRWPRTVIEHFTPVVIKDGDEHVWSGRIIAAPTTFAEDAEVVVQCQGWGQHLKDDCTAREWVIDDLSRWVDLRTLEGAPLAQATSQWDVKVDGGAIVLTQPWPNANSVWAANSWCGVTLDLGPNNVAGAISIDWTSSNNTPNSHLYAATHSSPHWGVGTRSDAFNFTNSGAGAAGTTSGSFAVPQRYVTIFVYQDVNATYGAEVYFRFSGVRVFTDNADRSAGASILKSSTIISETLDACAPLISPDRSKIAATATNLPNFPGSPGWKYGNELIDAANAIHGYVARLSPDPVPVFEFQPQPTDYSFAVGASEYTLLEPAAQDGRGVFSRVISEFEDAAGVRGESSSIDTATLTSPTQFTNPSFDVNTVGWSGGTFGTITRDTAIFHTAPASVSLTTALNGSVYTASLAPSPSLTGLAPGANYVLRFWWRRDATLLSSLFEIFGNYIRTDPFSTTPLGTFVPIEIPFIAPSSGSLTGTLSFLIQVTTAAATVAGRFDGFEILEIGTSIVTRRRFQRTALRPMGIKSNAATSLALAQLELSSSQFPPFKGTIGVTGRIRTKGGTTMPVTVLPSRVGDAILIENLTDPNTGALGRQGIIQSAKYNEAQDRVELTIDSAQSFISQLRARLRIGTA